MKAYSPGSGVVPGRYMTASLPSPRNASVAARSDPSASPSGFSWVTTRKRSCSRSASAIAFRSVVCVIVVRRELVDQLGHTHAALDRRIVLEGQLRSPLHSQLVGELRLEDSVRGLEPEKRGLLLATRAEDAHVDRRVPQVGSRVDSRDAYQADARVLELGQRPRQHVPHRLVDATH